ncbi:MAG: hypothetical protein ACKOW5_09135 [Actinomycetales bacterium]|jgi:hypothetical protein
MTNRDEVRATCQIPKSEHIIGWCAADDGAVLAATSGALYRGPQPWSAADGHALPWVRIATAVWETPHLTVTWEAGPDGNTFATSDLLRESARISQPGELPSAIQAMVTESVVYRQHVPLLDLPDETGALLVARRQPRAPDALVTWSVVFDVGLDPADPDLRAAADLALRQVRAALGI